MAIYNGYVSADSRIEVLKGNIPGHSITVSCASNSAVSTSLTALWDETGDYAFPSTSSQMKVSSSSANDASAGTGARTLKITYLDFNYVSQTETVVLTGQTAVLTIATNILRIQALEVVTAGSTLSNEGIIYIGTGTVTTGKPAVVYGLVSVGDNISHHGFFTVPVGKKWVLNDIIASVYKSKFVEFSINSRVYGGVFNKKLHINVNDTVILTTILNIVFTEKTDVKISALTDTGTSSANVIYSIYSIENLS